MRKLTIIIGIKAFNPKNAPSPDAITESPSPKILSPKKGFPLLATISKNTKPAAAAIQEFRRLISPRLSALYKMPKIMTGYEFASNTACSFMSVMHMTIIRDDKIIRNNVLKLKPKKKNKRANTTLVDASTSGYCMLIFSLQNLHLPPKNR